MSDGGTNVEGFYGTTKNARFRVLRTDCEKIPPKRNPEMDDLNKWAP